MVAHVGMHRVGEVQCRGIARQGQDVALGREEIDLVREQVDLDVLDELQRRVRARLRRDQVGEPLARARLRAACDMERTPIGNDDVRRARRAYLGNISYVDDWTGRLLQTLESGGLVLRGQAATGAT